MDNTLKLTPSSLPDDMRQLLGKGYPIIEPLNAEQSTLLGVTLDNMELVHAGILQMEGHRVPIEAYLREMLTWMDIIATLRQGYTLQKERADLLQSQLDDALSR